MKTKHIYNCQIINVKKIIIDWLKTNGYEGFYNNEEECSCNFENLMNCGTGNLKCSPGIIISTPDDPFIKNEK